MKVIDTAIPEVKIIEPQVFGDERGFFMETWRESWFNEQVCERRFVQDNHSKSRQGILRGLHYQMEHTQGKLVRVGPVKYSMSRWIFVKTHRPSANGSACCFRQTTAASCGCRRASPMASTSPVTVPRLSTAAPMSIIRLPSNLSAGMILTWPSSGRWSMASNRTCQPRMPTAPGLKMHFAFKSETRDLINEK